MFGRSPFFPSNKFQFHDLLQGVVWNSSLMPWYHVSVRILDQGNVSEHALVVPTFDELKRVLKRRSANFVVKSIEFVTPGHMNGTTGWRMEPLLEISELFNEGGWSIPRCTVSGSRIYRAMRLEPVSEWGNEQVVFRHRDAPDK